MIQEERENIITNENTAQDMLKNMIESMTKPLKKVNISETLSGDVDLSIFKEMGFGIPEEITFTNGKITNIYNIPEGLLELHCSNNILISIENIPKSIEVLEVQNNYLKSRPGQQPAAFEDGGTKHHARMSLECGESFTGLCVPQAQGVVV